MDQYGGKRRRSNAPDPRGRGKRFGPRRVKPLNHFVGEAGNIPVIKSTRQSDAIIRGDVLYLGLLAREIGCIAAVLFNLREQGL